MLELMRRLVRRRDNERGASAVEYGLLVAAIAAIVVVIVFAIGKVVQGSFQTTCENIAGEGDATAGAAECAAPADGTE